jgi:hypothetical protein
LLETGYAIHELVFGVLFLGIVTIPLRRGQWWAWWLAWVVLVADFGYTLTFGRHDATVFNRALIADIGLPVLLLSSCPGFSGEANGLSGGPAAEGREVSPTEHFTEPTRTCAGLRATEGNSTRRPDYGAGSGSALAELKVCTPASLSPSNGVTGLFGPGQKSSSFGSANHMPTRFRSTRTRLPSTRVEENASWI